MDYAGYLIAFAIGYFICKKKEDIKCFIGSMKFLYKYYRNNDKTYNEFFEANFRESDYVKEGDSFDE